jgi:hypothetical protein
MGAALPESFVRDTPIEGSSDRTFGLVFAGVFLAAGVLPGLRGGELRLWAIAASALVFVVSLAIPAVLHPANLAWTKFGLLLHTIVSPIALGVVFFCVAMPTGVVLRLLGKDLLGLKYDKTAKSYWKTRTGAGALNRQY